MGAVYGVVEHVTAGEGDPYYEFANPNNEVSSHFGIGNGKGGMADGLVEQYVDTQYQSWAQSAGNVNYLSVETEGMPDEPLTGNQVLSFAGIMAWAHTLYGIPLVSTDTPGQKGLITHGAGGMAWGGHYGCPGTLRANQRGQILYLASLIVNPPAPKPPTPPPAPPQEDEMLDHTPSGNGYWILKPDGSVWSYGDAQYHGGLNPGAPVGGGAMPAGVTAKSITAHPTQQGYWIYTTGGGVYAFGAAKYYGAP
jgi:hypothetical protein